MSDIRKYVAKRKTCDRLFAKNFDKGYNDFKIGVLLRQAREEVGITQEELARRLHTKKSAVSRIERHAHDIRLSTIERFAAALGKKFRIALS
ncbi:MAG: helix-turn-helix transcriptional regulator [Candidatus Omnitrophota bacterium]